MSTNAVKATCHACKAVFSAGLPVEGTRCPDCGGTVWVVAICQNCKERIRIGGTEVGTVSECPVCHEATIWNVVLDSDDQQMVVCTTGRVELHDVAAALDMARNSLSARVNDRFPVASQAATGKAAGMGDADRMDLLLCTLQCIAATEDSDEPREVFMRYPCIGAIELLERTCTGLSFTPRIRVVYETLFFSTAVVLWNIRLQLKVKRPDLFDAIEGGIHQALQDVVSDIEEDGSATSVVATFARRCSEYGGLMSSSFLNPLRVLGLRAYHPVSRAFLTHAFGEKMCSSSLVSDVARWAADFGFRLDRYAPRI